MTTSFPLLDKLVQLEPDFSHHTLFMTALMLMFKRRGNRRIVLFHKDCQTRPSL